MFNNKIIIYLRYIASLIQMLKKQGTNGCPLFYKHWCSKNWRFIGFFSEKAHRNAPISLPTRIFFKHSPMIVVLRWTIRFLEKNTAWIELKTALFLVFWLRHCRVWSEGVFLRGEAIVQHRTTNAAEIFWEHVRRSGIWWPNIGGPAQQILKIKGRDW